MAVYNYYYSAEHRRKRFKQGLARDYIQKEKMNLKFKPLNIESGIPLALINRSFSEEMNIYEGDRAEVNYKRKKLIAVVNTVKKLLEKDEISFSNEAIKSLKLKRGDKVKITLAPRPKSIEYILKKLDGKELTKKEVYSIIQDIVDNALTEAEIAYFVSGVYHNGMSLDETIFLTYAIAKTGNIIKWGTKNVVDKHSIGGIPGNRTTPIVVSICSAEGIIMPKTSSRAITSAAGTADVMKTVTNVSLSEEKLKKVVEKTNACLAWGGSLGLAPADDRLVGVERLLNVDPEAQLIASILAKKISVGSKYILIDIPYGEGAKVGVAQALQLKKKFSRVGKHFGLKISVVLTKGSEPIGNGIGPVLEMIDILKVLKRENPPLDLEEKSIFLAGEILEAMGKAKRGEGRNLARKVLDSGKAYKKFEEIISAQGKTNAVLEPADFRHDIMAQKDSKIVSINNKEINLLARILGCPTSPSSGIYLYKHCDSQLKKGELILTLYSDSEQKLREGIEYYSSAKPIKLEV